MIEGQPDDFFRTLIARIDDRVRPLGFRHLDGGEWERPRGWRVDLIDLCEAGPGLVINLYAWMPCYPSDGGEACGEALAVEGLGHALGRARPDLDRPALESALAFVDRVVADLERGIEWFERFDTRAKCLTVLDTGGKCAGAPATEALRGYLLGLPLTADEPGRQ